MKKFKVLALALAIMLLVSCVFFGTKTYATEVQESSDEDQAAVVTSGEEHDHDHDHENEEEREVHEGDMFVLFGEGNENGITYVMDKYVDGNLFIIGNDVKISGMVNGSLFVLAANVTLDEKAYIAAHSFICAETVTMSGFTWDMYATCANFNMTKTGVVYRDLRLVTNNATLLGGAGRDIDITANTIKVYEDEENKFYVGRNLTYNSGTEIENLNDITVEGEVKYTKTEEKTENVVLNYVYRGAQSIILVLVIYAILLWIAPKFVEKSKGYISTRALLAVAVGFAFIILVPILAFILLLTYVGVPVAAIIAIIYALVLVISSAVVSIGINEFIANKVKTLNTKWKKLLMIIPVSLVIFLIKQIPYVGGYIGVVIFLIGTGIITLYGFDKSKKNKVEE